MSDPATLAKLQKKDMATIYLEDGTKCVVLRGTGISCDWTGIRKKKD